MAATFLRPSGASGTRSRSKNICLTARERDACSKKRTLGSKRASVSVQTKWQAASPPFRDVRCHGRCWEKGGLHLLAVSLTARDPEQTLRSAFKLPTEPSEVGLAWRDDARRPGGFDEEFVAIYSIVTSRSACDPVWNR